MNAVIRDMAEKLVVAIHAAIKDEEPLKKARDKAYQDYSKANDVYVKSRRNIAELCSGLDAMVPPPATYPVPDQWREPGGAPLGRSDEYMVTRDRCYELRAIAEQNRLLAEQNRKQAEEAQARGETTLAQRAPQEVR